MFLRVVLIAISITSRSLSCNVDKRTAILYATSLGRAMQYVVRECVPMLDAVKPAPPSDLAYKFVSSLCDIGQECAAELQSVDVQILIPCGRARMWEIWGDHPMYSLEMKKYIEEIMICAVSAAPDANVAWLMFDLALQIAG
ncbi:uncharacterized protein LOC144166103 [Haemaphysalis longicornis]